jgi:hypothetical protein
MAVLMAARRCELPKTPATYTPCSKLNITIKSFHLLELQTKFAAKPYKAAVCFNLNTYLAPYLVVLNVYNADGAIGRSLHVEQQIESPNPLPKKINVFVAAK